MFSQNIWYWNILKAKMFTESAFQAQKEHKSPKSEAFCVERYFDENMLCSYPFLSKRFKQ